MSPNSGGDTAETLGPLRVGFAGRSWTLPPTEVHLMGRGGDIDLGDDLAMHREVAAFSVVAGRWFIVSRLEDKRLTVSGRDAGGPAPVALHYQDDLQLHEGRLRLSFRIGTELQTVDVDVPPRPASAGIPVPDSRRRVVVRTVAAHPETSLTPSQRLLAVAMAELRLLDPRSTSPLPARSEICRRLGWTERQYFRHLEGVCLALHEVGVDGVVGTAQDPCDDRRENAVDALIETRSITFDDLRLLPDD
ncbi:MAG: hypothetical protein ABIW84_11070 [Ilumatobacteraceae bacterium]